MADDFPEIPPVCVDDDLTRIFIWSKTTIKRRRRAGTFPIPELLPQLDHRHRYSRRDVLAYLNRENVREGRQRPALVMRRA